MNVFTGARDENTIKGGSHMIHEHIGPGRPLLPHERRALIHIDFDENDWNILKKVFHDEDTANAAAEIIREAPPEIQILALQLMEKIRTKEVA